MTRRQTTAPTRRDVFRLAVGASALSAGVAAVGEDVRAQGKGPIRVDVDSSSLRPRPIAIPIFLSEDSKLGAEVADIIAADLAGSGLFQPLDRSAFPPVRDFNGPIQFADWRAGGAEALLTGRVSRLPDGRIDGAFRLWDVVLEKALDGQRVGTTPQSWRRFAHIIADRVYEKMTLERGYFDTRVVFVDETGAKDRRVKRLAIMDQDGHNVGLLSDGRELVLTPRFSPTGQMIAFMSYAGQKPSVGTMNLATRERQLIGDLGGMTFAPRFSPDGQRLVFSLQSEGSSSIVEMDLRSRQSRRLTQGPAIDTAPCFSPDGQSLVFESDREGNQQLYVMAAGGGPARRLSYGEGRYSTPVWSPRGDTIAFTKQASGRFLIGVMRTDGSGERILTDGFHNEGPTWAPNGRVLMFFREERGANAGPRIFSVDLTGRIERAIPTPSFGSDPAWSPLLK
ncbi:MAG TPA: Tol-Pal system beta propeller repeat protein TolB [Hyphomicrobiaceae bacterium]|nr:Tol-Pal system beta propeller repeat protein TolB [Hyphomicrobiaceae bacterium]